MKNISINICFFLSFMVSISGNAQVQEQLSPTERKQQTVVTEPITPYKGFFKVGMYSTYSVIDKVFIDSKKQSISGNIWGKYILFGTFITYGITDRLMIDLSIPYKSDAIYQSYLAEAPLDNFQKEFKWKTQGKGLSDIDLTMGYQLITEKMTTPALAALVDVTLPTGQKDITHVDPNDPNVYDRPTGNGEVAVDTKLRMRKVNFPFAYVVNVSYKLRTSGKRIVEPGGPSVPFKNGNMFNFSGAFHIHLNDWIAFKNMVDYFNIGKDEVNQVKEDKGKWLLQYTPGMSFQMKRFRFDQAVMIPLKANNNAADPGYVLIIQYIF